jgi:predicted dehydrogenase
VKIYRVGISGAGFGVKAHLPALRAHPRFEVVALASPASAAAIAKERNIPQSFTSAHEMIAACELDCVVVASPPFAHRDDVLAALDARKNVLCEKPFGLNVEEAEEMLAASLNAQTACGVSHEFRFVPQRMALKELVANGHLKPLRQIEIAHFSSNLRLINTERPRGWWFQKERGGGEAGALLSHIIDSANWTVGRGPKSVSGFIRTANPRRRDAHGEFTSTVDDGAFALLDYGDGLVGRLTADGTMAVDSFTMAIHAENRTAVASGKSIAEMELFTIDDEETNELQCKASPYEKFAMLSKDAPANVPLLMELYDEWVKQIETGTSALPTFDEALVTQRILAEIGYTVSS